MSKAYLLVICLLSASFTGCLSEIGSGSDRTYQVFDVWDTEGSFAPDPDQDQDAVIKFIETIMEDPLQFEQEANNVSWRSYEHNFFIRLL